MKVLYRGRRLYVARFPRWVFSLNRDDYGSATIVNFGPFYISWWRKP